MLRGEGPARGVSGVVAGQVGAGESYVSFWGGHIHTSFWVKDGKDVSATSEYWETGC